METIFNFDMNAIKELNFKGMKEYKAKCEIRKDGEKINKLVLDADDILILKFIVGVGNSKNAVVDVTDSSFFWVNLNKLLEEYDGLLFLSKTALQVRLSKYQMMGIVDRKCVKNEKGSFSFFKLTGIKMLMKKECKEQVVETEEQAIKSIIDATGATKEEAKNEFYNAKNRCDTKRTSAYKSYAITSIKQKRSSRTYNTSNNRFNNFQQRSYSKEDFKNMERMLLQKNN